MDDFAILPWEYPGANFDPAPHAQTTLEIAGQKRNFLLKMRDGIIYFKDSRRAPLFAIPHHFETGLRGDDLISAWQDEMVRENFGHCYARTATFNGCIGTTVVTSIIRTDFSGWMSDALHLDWREIPRHRDGRTINLWKNSTSPATWRAILKVRNSLRDRVMPASERQPIQPHWVSGDEKQLRYLFALIMQLYTRRNGSDSSRTWKYRATNIASSGAFDGGFGPLYNRDLHISSALPALLRLLKQHFVWVALDWKCGLLHPPQNDESWRGRYCIVIPSLELHAPLMASLSNHERLELLLQLRDWLEGKVSPRQSANWLSQALE